MPMFFHEMCDSVTFVDGYRPMPFQERWRRYGRMVTRKEADRLRAEQWRKFYDW